MFIEFFGSINLHLPLLLARGLINNLCILLCFVFKFETKNSSSQTHNQVIQSDPFIPQLEVT